jgi:hypothetical protein
MKLIYIFIHMTVDEIVSNLFHHPSPNIINVIKSGRTSWASDVACTRKW